MNKRIRKKRHRGEFNYKGFGVECAFYPELEEEQIDIFIDEFIEFCEAHSLGTGGVTDVNRMFQFITKMIETKRKGARGSPRFRYSNCTEEDRELVSNYLQSLSYVQNVIIYPLEGAW